MYMKKLTRFEKKELYNRLTESFGVNADVLEWSVFIKNILYEQIVGFTEKLEDKDFYTKTLKQLDKDDDDSYTNTVEIYLDEFILNEQIDEKISKNNSIKLRDFKIDFILTFIDNVDFELNYFNAFYNDTDAFLDEDKNLIGANFFFDFYIPYDYLDLEKNDINTLTNFLIKNEKIDTKVDGMIAHEMTHSLEFYNRKLNGAETFPDRLTNFLINTYKDDNITNLTNDWKPFLNLVYLDLSFERNARIPQLYSMIKNENIENEKDFFNVVSKSEVWNDMIQLRDFNAKDYYDGFSYNMSDDDIDTVLSEYKGTTKDKIFKVLLEKWNSIMDLVNEDFEKYGDTKLKKLTLYTLDNPMKFLTYWEKRFHFHWDDFNKKINRLYSITKNK